MARKGFSGIVAYIDDFLIITETFEECRQALATLLSLLRKLGFMINWNKVVDPCQQIVFLGVEIDSILLCLRLPADKLEAFRKELAHFSKLKRASKHQLQQLAGRLNWAAAVVRGGRVYLRNVINMINRLKSKRSRVCLSQDVQEDIQWWHSFIQLFNGKSAVLDSTPITCVYTVACGKGAGAYFIDDWAYCNWARDWPEMADLHINHKEALAVALACYRWCHLWTGKKILILSDNQTAVSTINRGTSRDRRVMDTLRGVFWLSAIFGFHLCARYFPGHQNVTADCVSCLHERGRLQQLCGLLPLGQIYPLSYHMCMQTDTCSFICRCAEASAFAIPDPP